MQVIIIMSLAVCAIISVQAQSNPITNPGAAAVDQGDTAKPVTTVVATPAPAGKPRAIYLNFTNPSKIQFRSDMPLVKAGTIFQISWENSKMGGPDIPAAVKLAYRSGTWPKVSNFTVLLDNGTNPQYFNWEIPENQFPDTYIFMLTPINRTDVAAVASYPIYIYQHVQYINVNSVASVQALSVLLTMALALVIAAFN